MRGRRGFPSASRIDFPQLSPEASGVRLRERYQGAVPVRRGMPLSRLWRVGVYVGLLVYDVAVVQVVKVK